MKDKIIEVMNDGKMSFWKKKGDNSWSRDIMKLSELIKQGWKFK